jgi:hypothetical protein
MNNRWQRNWFDIACAMALLATSFAGCKHGPPLHSNPAGGACVEPMYYEYPFYGYNPTCWQPWPPGWVGCPTICPEAYPYPHESWEALPPGTTPLPPQSGPSLQSTEPLPPEMPSTEPAPDALPAPTPTIPPSSRLRPDVRLKRSSHAKTDSKSSLQLVGDEQSSEPSDLDYRAATRGTRRSPASDARLLTRRPHQKAAGVDAPDVPAPPRLTKSSDDDTPSAESRSANSAKTKSAATARKPSPAPLSMAEVLGKEEPDNARSLAPFRMSRRGIVRGAAYRRQP